MPRSVTAIVKFWKAFPPDDPLSGPMARLMVLWADARLEFDGIGKDPGYEGMGTTERDVVYRRLYFMRANLVTLYEGRELLGDLVKDATFASWLKEHDEVREQFFKYKKEVDRRADYCIKVRDAIGGHAGRAIYEGIKKMGPDAEGFMEIEGDTMLRPHIALDIVMAAFMPDVKPADWMARFKERIEPLYDALAALMSAMHLAAHLYIIKRPALFPT
jgi:hypothetical protein